jgi:hypothetical protein
LGDFWAETALAAVTASARAPLQSIAAARRFCVRSPERYPWRSRPESPAGPPRLLPFSVASSDTLGATVISRAADLGSRSAAGKLLVPSLPGGADLAVSMARELERSRRKMPYTADSSWDAESVPQTGSHTTAGCYGRVWKQAESNTAAGVMVEFRRSFGIKRLREVMVLSLEGGRE